jgi:hypothetical protein
MKKTGAIFASVLIGLALIIQTQAKAEEKTAGGKSAAELEKEKALKNPYPNDLGPDKIDVSKYNAEQQEGYKLLQDKCSRCHTPSRPLNSQFLQLNPEEAAKIRQTTPEIFKDKQVWQVEDNIWMRYVKRMMSKPGCGIAEADAKKIYHFLVEDSKRRKTGASAASWAEHRRKLLSQFKIKYPDRYKDLFETK